jgi:hypothetical protein
VPREAERLRYIVGAASGQSLASFLPQLKADPEIVVVDDRNRRLLVVETTHAHAARLRERYAGLLVIEPDAPLSPLNS